MAQILRLANENEDWRDPKEWVETQTHSEIVSSLDKVRARDGFCATVIAGAPGIGKTLAVEGYCLDMGLNGYYHRAVKGEGTAWQLATALMKRFDSSPMGMSLGDARDRIADWIGPKALLVFDEAQFFIQRNRKTGVKDEVFEWARGLAETAQCNLAFCGDLSIVRTVAEYPMLQSRVRYPVIVRSVPETDVRAVASGTGFDGPDCLRILLAVSALPGGLRNVESVLHEAAAFAGSDQREAAHLRAAVHDLKLTLKGGF